LRVTQLSQMESELTLKICRYIHKNFRSQYKSNMEFADACGIDEKTVRLIQQEKYNLSLLKFKQICDAQSTKMSDVLKDISE
jgi:DNA-binding XRE family transcriptional regulator